MANNRLLLVCRRCSERKLLAKYYPSTSWYLFPLAEDLNRWLEDHSNHAVDSQMWGTREGKSPFYLELEHTEP